MKMDNDSTTPHSCEYRYNTKKNFKTLLATMYSGPIWFVNRESEINGIMKSQKREEK